LDGTMDSVYQVVESVHFFIPIIAVAVVCGTLFFCKTRPEEDEFLFSAAEDPELLRVYKELKEIKKKES